VRDTEEDGVEAIEDEKDQHGAKHPRVEGHAIRDIGTRRRAQQSDS
jgi:hypothetical protein